MVNNMTTEWDTTNIPPMSTESTPTMFPGFTKQMVEFIALEIIWLTYCCTGNRTNNQGLRVICLGVGAVHIVVENVGRGQPDYTTSWFVAYLLTRIKIGPTKAGVVKVLLFLAWTMLDVSSIWITYLSWITVVAEALVVLGLLFYMYTQVCRLKGTLTAFWFIRMIHIWVWGLGWGTLSILCLMDITSNLPLVVWFIMYGYLFPLLNVPPADVPPEPPRRFGSAPGSRLSRWSGHFYEEVHDPLR